MTEAFAKKSLTVGITLLGVTLADLSLIVTMIAGLCAAVASIAAAYYYIKKARQ